MTKIFTLGKGQEAEQVAQTIKNYLHSSEDMDSQIIPGQNGEFVVQGRGRDRYINMFLGLDKAINVRIVPVGEKQVALDISKGKWIDKPLALAIAWYAYWPILVTSSYGIYKQSTLPNKIYKCVQAYVGMAEKSVEPEVEEGNEVYEEHYIIRTT